MNKKRDRRRKNQKKTALDQVVSDFLPCGRCSFFLSGYRTIHGDDDLQAAAESRDDDWLSLSWNQETRHLVRDSFGGRLDVELYYYNGRCPECQRRFVYRAAEEGEEEVSFRVELKGG